MFNRFAQRAGEYELSLSNVKWNPFRTARFDTKPRLQLYHVVRSNEHVDSIFKHGFEASDGNKGVGVYLANHALYGIRWAGDDFSIIVCDIPLCQVESTQNVKRFYSEVTGPLDCNSEYVIHPKLVFPQLAFNYKKTNQPIDIRACFTERGKFGCPTCDPKMIRCDCLLDPHYLDSDLVTEPMLAFL